MSKAGMNFSNSIFECSVWLDIVAPGQWNEVFAYNELGEIIGRMVYVFNGRKVYMPTLTQNLGIWMADYVKYDYEKQESIIKELFEQLPPCRSFEQTLSAVNHFISPLLCGGYSVSTAFTYRLNDLSDLEKVFANFNKQTKKNIRRSDKITTISYESNTDVLIDVMEKTFKHQNRNLPVNKDLIRKIVSVCDKTGHGKMFIAQDAEGHVQVAAYLVFDENCAYALLSGSDPLYRGSEAKSRVYWEEIQYAAKVSKVFDFEGSSIEGIENIIRQFGGVCTPLYTIYKTSFLNEIWYVAKPRIKRLIGYKI